MRSRTIILGVVVSTFALTAIACGGDNDSDNSTGSGGRAIDIEMRDTAYSPNSISVPAGEEVRLVFHNVGKVDHDAFIGDDMAQADHDKEMNDDMGMHHGSDDRDAITVKPGKSGTLTHTFKAGDNVLIGCHQPGHYAGGMKLTIDVT